MKPLRPVTEGREKADALRFEHSLGAAPIRDVFGLLERFDPDLLVVRRPMPGGPHAVLVRAHGRRLVAVNTHECVLRVQRFAAMHVFAHLLFEGADPTLTLHVDRGMLEDGSPVERRADAFAANLLVPVAVLQVRLAAHDPGTWTKEELVLLALEYGISVRALLWHIRQSLPLTESGRHNLASMREPTPEESLYIASRAGLLELVREGRSARDRYGWPRRYASLAARAYDRGRLSEAQLAELLRNPLSVRDIVELAKLGGPAVERSPVLDSGAASSVARTASAPAPRGRTARSDL